MISVIVPVFNSEKTIKKCIDSVLSQDFSDFEIIVVNDGSTDTTQDILNGIKDYRLKVFNQKNSGVSVARNYAISKSSGEFVVFLDSDDFIDKHFLSMVENITKRTNPGVLVFDINIIKNGVSEIFKDYAKDNFNKDLFYELKPTDCIKMLAKNIAKGYVGNKVFRKDIIKDIKFNKYLSLCEDKVFLFDIFKSCMENHFKIFKVNRGFYNYIFIPKIPKQSQFLQHMRIFHFLKKYNFYDDFKFDILNHRMNAFILAIYNPEIFSKARLKKISFYICKMDYKIYLKSHFYRTVMDSNLITKIIFGTCKVFKSKTLTYFMLELIIFYKKVKKCKMSVFL